MHKIDFSVPLSGSVLFDLNSRLIAQRLCERFVGLQYRMELNSIHIFGELNDYWYEKYTRAVFEIGNIEA